MALLKPRPKSAARSRLAELIAERAKIVDRANEIMAASKRLDEAIAAPAAAQADLNRLSAAEFSGHTRLVARPYVAKAGRRRRAPRDLGPRAPRSSSRRRCGSGRPANA